MINAILDRDDTRVLVKAIEDAILGWICFARGKHADTVHWVQSRYKVTPTGAILRRKGTMSELVDAAQLKPFVAYTLRGEAGTVAPDGEFAFRGKGHRIGISSSDAMISKWLMNKRDIGSAYINLKEWMAR